MQGDDTVRVAIEANDYSQLSSEMQNKISEKKFAKMSQHKERKNAIKKALEANDYNLLPDTAKKRMSQEKFDQKVKHYNQKQAHKKAITQAVATNDFSAFEAAMETHRAEKEANRSSDDSKHHNKPELTDEQKQEKFQKLVDYYNENGELPEHGPRMGGHKK